MDFSGIAVVKEMEFEAYVSLRGFTMRKVVSELKRVKVFETVISNSRMRLFTASSGRTSLEVCFL